MKQIKIELEIDDEIHAMLESALSQNPQNPDVTGLCLTFVRDGIARAIQQIALSKIAVVPNSKPGINPASRPMEAAHGVNRGKGRKSKTSN